jgi:phage tail sheath protein FI
MSFNLGTNVLEVDGRTAPAIPAAPLSTAAFLVASERGVPNVPVRLGGVLDYVNAFGGYTDTSFGLHAVRGFFENGGSDAYAVRVVGAGAVAAAVSIPDQLGPNTLRVEAGRRGRADPGLWGNELRVSVPEHPRGTSFLPAQVRGSTQEPFNVPNGNTLVLTVNGGATPVTVTFANADFATPGAATAVEVVRVINRTTTAVRAAATADGRVLIGTANPGPRGRVDIVGTAATVLGFTAPANTDASLATGTTTVLLQATGGLLPTAAVRLETRGHVIAGTGLTLPFGASPTGFAIAVDGAAAFDVLLTDADFAGGLAGATAPEVVLAIARQAQAFTAALNYQDRLVLLSERYGAGSSIAVGAPAGAGVSSALVPLGLVGAGFTTVAGARQSATIATLDEAGRVATLAPALTAAVPANASRIQSVEFDLVIGRNGLEIERWESLSMQPGLPYTATSVVNDPLAGSRYVRIQDLASASPPGDDAPRGRTAAGTLISYVVGSTTAGAEPNAPGDAQYIGDPAARTGLYSLDTVAIQLLACPETTSLGVANASLGYAENRGELMFVGTVPAGSDLQAAKTYASALRGRKVYGALYAPWIGISNPRDVDGSNPILQVPPVGHVLGVYARIADLRGVWKAPAGDEALLRGALAVDFPTTDAEHTDLVKNGGVNTIRFIPGSGIVVDASRTLSSDPRWLYVGTRRLFNFVKASLRDGLRWVAQEPHSEELRRMVRFNVVTPFLRGLWQRGAFGSDPADAVFTVKCDAENNPPAEVQLGNFRVEVYFYPVRPAETIVIVVGQQDSAAAAGEA